MNTVSYRELKAWYLSDDAKATAKKYFGSKQPSIYRTGFYSSPSWNWGYLIGIVGVTVDIGDSEGVEYGETTTKWFEVVTQFGGVVGAREINLPVIKMEAK